MSRKKRAAHCEVFRYRKGPMKGKRRRICWGADGKIKSNTKA